MNCICLIAALILSMLPQQKQIDNGHLKRHQNILENYGISGDSVGANQFLNSLFPDSGTKAEIDKLIRNLAGPTYLQREAAEKGLAARGPSALNQIQQATENGDTETRSRAKRCIAAIESTHQQLVTSALEVLKLDSSENPSPVEKLTTILRVLRELKQHKRYLIEAPRSFVDSTCRDEIRSGLKDTDADIRIACILSLPECFSENELRQFSWLIESEDPAIAVAAIKTIGFVLPARAADRLVKNLSHPDETARRSSATVLRTISSKYFGFQADSPAKSRRVAVGKWKSWVGENSPITITHFEKLATGIAAPPTGFLVSVSGSSVCQFDLAGQQIWEYQTDLYDAQYISESQIIIAERNRNLIRVINRSGQTQLRITSVNSPSDVEMLDNGNVLALSGTGKLYEFSNGKLVKTFTGMNNPFDADRLPNGDTIVADSGNNRLVIYNPHGKIIWQKTELAFPNNVHWLPDGRMVFTTYTTGDVVMLDAEGTELWRRNLPGSTLYSVYATANEVFVADGSNSKIWVLDAAGKPSREIKIAKRFCDVDFITK